jgi:hypothetical protein
LIGKENLGVSMDETIDESERKVADVVIGVLRNVQTL